MLTIRLQRAGKKNKPEYRIVLAEKTAASQKKFTEVLGSYNPHTKALVIKDQERLNYWKDEQHVELSATVHNLLVTKDLIKEPKTKAFTIPKKEVVAEETPAEAPAVAPEATPDAEVPATETEAPAEVSTETPAEAPVEAPTEAPAVEAVAETAPAETAPIEAPVEAPAPEAQVEEQA